MTRATSAEDVLAIWIAHLRRSGDQEDLATGPSDPNVELRIRIARLPSFREPHGVRLDVLHDAVRIVRFAGRSITAGALPRDDHDVAALLHAVSVALDERRSPAEGLDGETVVVERATRVDYRAVTSWYPSAQRDADLLALEERAEALARRSSPPPVSGGW